MSNNNNCESQLQFNNYSCECQDFGGVFHEIAYNDLCMLFSDWITKKYIEWRGRTVGNSGSVAEFARLFGASQQLMSDWMKKGGKVPRSRKYISALVKVYGDEVYSVLGLPAPDFPVAIDRLPPAMRNALIAATRELADTLAESKIDPDSDEAEELTVSIMEKHGFRWTRTVRESSESKTK